MMLIKNKVLMTKYLNLTSKIAILILLVCFFHAATAISRNESNPELEYSDTLPFPMSKREAYEINNNGFIKSKFKVKSTVINNNAIVMSGILERGFVAFVDSAKATPFTIELISSDIMPKEISQGKKLSHCILKGDSRGDLSSERIFIKASSLNCRNKDKSTPIEIQTNAIWLDKKGLNGIKGIAIVGGVKDNEKYNSTKRLYNVEDLTETILNNAETTIPAIFIPRKTKVQIVFPLNNKK